MNKQLTILIATLMFFSCNNSNKSDAPDDNNLTEGSKKETPKTNSLKGNWVGLYTHNGAVPIPGQTVEMDFSETKLAWMTHFKGTVDNPSYYKYETKDDSLFLIDTIFHGSNNDKLRIEFLSDTKLILNRKSEKSDDRWTFDMK
jgi:hypothetical protein